VAVVRSLALTLPQAGESARVSRDEEITHGARTPFVERDPHAACACIEDVLDAFHLIYQPVG
jgi:hypothetical protein